MYLYALNPPSVLFQVSKETDERGKAKVKKPVPWSWRERALFEESPGCSWKKTQNCIPLQRGIAMLEGIHQPTHAPFLLTLAVVQTPGWGVIDFDPATVEQKQLTAQLAGAYRRAGYAVDVTPSGGCHLFFEWEGDERNTTGVIETEAGELAVDVFLSTHLTAIYEKNCVYGAFLSKSDAQKILSLVLVKSKRNRTTYDLTDNGKQPVQLDVRKKIKTGERWLSLQRIAARLAGAPPDVIARLLHAINRMLCEPPLDDESVAEQARWAASIPSIEECETKLSIGSWWFGSKLTRARQLQKRLRLPADVAMALINLVG